MNAHILQRIFRQQARQGFRDLLPRHLEFRPGKLHLKHLPKRLQPLGGSVARKEQFNDFKRPKPIDHLFKRTVVFDFPFVDHDGPSAESLHILHVVAGQQHGQLPLRLVVLEEFLDSTLRDHVETNRRFVQQQHIRIVQQRGDQLHPHPLSQRQFADWLVDQSGDLQKIHQLGQSPFEDLRIQPVDLAMETE